jgi:hypothetical protein
MPKATSISTCSQAKARSGWRTQPTTASSPHGDFLFFNRGIVHALPDLLETPLVFLAIDTPRRDPKDIIFVHPEDGTGETFIRNLNA